MFKLLHRARPVLLDLTGTLDAVGCMVARYDGAWTLPLLGEVPAPAAVLIRPDGYVAWVGIGSSDGLQEALGR